MPKRADVTLFRMPLDEFDEFTIAGFEMKAGHIDGPANALSYRYIEIFDLLV